MAGSLNHIVDENGDFTMDFIDHLGDAHEALEECFHIIAALSGGRREDLEPVLQGLSYPKIKADMRSSRGADR